MSLQSLWTRCRQTPELLFWATVLFLVLSFGAIYLVDVVEIFGLRERFFGHALVPYMWFHWFFTPVERPIQFLLLATAAFLAFRTFARWPEGRDPDLRSLWLWWGVGLLLMYLEETLDIRHLIRDLLTQNVGVVRFGAVGGLVELALFGAIGLVMLYVFWKSRRRLWDAGRLRTYMVVAYLMYATAVGLSWGGRLLSSHDSYEAAYAVVGGWLLDHLLLVDDRQIQLFEQVNRMLADRDEFGLEFWIMDRVVEESFELLGAAAMLVAVVYAIRQTRRRLGESDD